jgi:hypothetical protein
MRLPEPAAPPVEDSPETRPKKVDVGAPASSGEDDKVAASNGERDAAVSAPASGAPVTGAPGVQPPTKEATADENAAPTDTIAPDGGWQKPEWAQPDNEITIRRGPDQEDEKIVLPADKSE